MKVVGLALAALVGLSFGNVDSELAKLESDVDAAHQVDSNQDFSIDDSKLEVSSHAQAHTEAMSRAQSQAATKALVADQAKRVLHDIAKVRADLKAARSKKNARNMRPLSEMETALAVSSKAHARLTRERARKVLADIARVRADIDREESKGENQAALEVSKPSIASRVQVSVDAVHCRNLKMIEEIDGVDSEQYKEYLEKIYDAQKQQEGNFKVIRMLEKLYPGVKKDEGIRVGEVRVNPCTRYGQAGSGEVKVDAPANFGVSPMTGLPYETARERDLSVSIWRGRYESGDAAQKELYGAYLCSLDLCPPGYKPDNPGVIKRFENFIRNGFKSN